MKGRGRGEAGTGDGGVGRWEPPLPLQPASSLLPSLPLPLLIVAPTQRPTDREGDGDLCDVEAREGNGGRMRGDRERERRGLIHAGGCARMEERGRKLDLLSEWLSPARVEHQHEMIHGWTFHSSSYSIGKQNTVNNI